MNLVRTMDFHKGDIFTSGISLPEIYKLVSSERIEDSEFETGVLLYIYTPEFALRCKHCLKQTIACMYASGVSSVHDTGEGILADWVEENTPLSDTITRVVRCAFRLQEMCKIQWRKNHSNQSLQLVISAGRFSRVKLEEHQCCVATGPAVDEISSVKALMESGTIILSPEAWQLCDREQLTVTDTENEKAVKVQHIRRTHRVTKEDLNLYNLMMSVIGDPCRMYLIANVEREKILCKIIELTALKMQAEEAPPEPQSSFHGVSRESDSRKNNLLPLTASDHTVWCRFCGEKATPPLDFSKTPNPEDFCCARYMELFKKMKQHWCSLQEQAGGLSQEHDSDMENTQEQRDTERAQNISQQVATKRPRKAKRGASGSQNKMPGCVVTSCDKFTTINFRLSDYVLWKRNVRLAGGEDDVKEENPGPSKLCSTTSSVPAGFGLCNYKGQMQKFYSNGKKFLTALSDGTAQVYYPSGNLAIIALRDDTVGVCIVLDDIITNCPIRAFFTSNGDAFCYHGNGSTWLHMDEWGGQSLNQDGSRRSKWTWTAHMDNPTRFKPIYLSLNKNIGVRVQGHESVFVTFLGSGQQARFSVGSSMKPREPAPPLCKDELMVQVTQLNARLALERLRRCLVSQPETRGRSFRLPPFLVSQGKKLLRLSSSVTMEEKDKDYIQHCLQDCQ